MAKPGDGYNVRILDNKSNPIVSAELLLEEDFSPQISNTYDNLIGNKGSVQLSAIGAMFRSTSAMGLSGQFKQQGFQVWQETKPLEVKLALSLYMKTSGKDDVYDPAMTIIKRSVPTESDNGFGLIPPGPSLLDAIGIDPDEANAVIDIFADSEGALIIEIGKFITLRNAIIVNAIPTFSAQKDSDGYPVKCKLDVDIRTVEVVTKQILEDWDVNTDNTRKETRIY